MPPQVPQIRLYQDWLLAQHGLSFDSYDALWRWSTTDLNAFWQSIWDYFELRSSSPCSVVCDGAPMPDTRWFVGAKINYAAEVLRHVQSAQAAGVPAILSHNEKSLGKSPARETSWSELRRQVASLALHLQTQGVQPGDRVVAYLPNAPEAMVAFLATVSIGAIWSICAPDMGTNAVLDRFKQIAPKVLIACDGVTYGGCDIDRSAVITELCAALPSVQHLVLHSNLGLVTDLSKIFPDSVNFNETIRRDDAQTQAFEPLWLEFEHPLWIVYSSGTTGLPKPIVHGHGGTVLVGRTLLCLHNDVGCSYAPNSLGERYHWYSSTGWVMWNAQTSGLLAGVTCCIFDGNPAGRTVDASGNKVEPDWTTLWRFAAELGVTFFGAGAAFYANCQKVGVDLGTCGDLSRVRALGTTGSPLSADAQAWGTDQFRRLTNMYRHEGEEFSAGPPQGKLAPPGGSELHEVNERGGNIWWSNISGGTDFCGAFIGGNRELPQVPGEMQCRLLGCAV